MKRNRTLLSLIQMCFGGDHITPLDITDVGAVLSFVRERKPDAIINCAAHTNVDKCETDADNAYKINAVSPRNLSIAATERIL